MESDASDALTSDEIYVLKQGNILGPFTRERLRTALAGRELNPEDFAQTGGVPIWQPLARIIGDVEVELRGAIAPDWKSLLHWAWLRLRYDIDERSEIAGSVCLGIGLLVLALSHWTFLFWLPWTGAALLAAVALLQRRRFGTGILLLLGVILLPLGVFIWHSKLKPAGALPFQSSEVASPEASAPAGELPESNLEPEPPVEPSAERTEPQTPQPAPTIPVAPPKAQATPVQPAPAQPAAPVAVSRPLPPPPPPPVITSSATSATPAIAKAPEPSRDLTTLTDISKPTDAAQGGALVQQHRTALVVVKDRKGAGSGFVAMAGGKPWLFTNIHVSAGMAAPEFTRIDGQRITPGVAEAATEHDVMRFALSEPQTGGLEVMADVEATARLGDLVVVLGNSGGGGVVTSLPGELVGIGPDRVEVTAPFIPGNSGSPIIHVPSGRVIGIATYLTRRYDEFASPQGNAAAGKKDEGAVVVRRFGYRLDKVKQWQPLNWAAFQAEARSIAEISALTGDVFDFFEALRTQKVPHFATATLRRPAEAWLATISRPHLSDADRESATRGFLGSLRSLVLADVTAAEGKFRYACFRDELRREREVRDRLYKAFDEKAKAMSAPSIGRNR
jgi:outer membrane biosynthesis protein TonB